MSLVPESIAGFRKEAIKDRLSLAMNTIKDVVLWSEEKLASDEEVGTS